MDGSGWERVGSEGDGDGAVQTGLKSRGGDERSRREFLELFSGVALYPIIT